MKISCTRENLQKGVQTVLRAVAIRPTLPILTNIYLATDKGRLKIAATDLEIGITTWVGTKIEQEGAITIPARVFAEFIQSIRDETIHLAVVNQRLTITSEHMKAEIAGQAASEFPIIPSVKREQTLIVSSALLKEGIRQVVFAVAIDETRPSLTALALRAQGKEVKLVATDSYRLSEKTIPLNGPINSPITLLIPARSAQEVERLIDLSLDQVEMITSENQILFRFGSTEIVSRLIDGQYPEYEAIIPKQTSTTVIVEVATTTDGLRSSMIFARESANQVTFGVDQKNSQEITISAQSTQVGGNTAKIPASVAGESVTITCNAKFVLDVLSILSTDRVEFGFNEPTTPIVIKPEKQTGYIAVIMPLKTG